MKPHPRRANVALLALTMAVGLLALSQSGGTRTASANSPNDALNVQVQASQGFAAPGNTQPANFLVLVTDRTGTPVVSLTQSDFQVVDHFSLPGQTCGFGSNNIVSFVNTNTGAYQIQVGLNTNVPGCHWVEGDYLSQVIVINGTMRGQGAATLSVKCPQRCSAAGV